MEERGEAGVNEKGGTDMGGKGEKGGERGEQGERGERSEKGAEGEKSGKGMVSEKGERSEKVSSDKESMGRGEEGDKGVGGFNQEKGEKGEKGGTGEKYRTGIAVEESSEEESSEEERSEKEMKMLDAVYREAVDKGRQEALSAVAMVLPASHPHALEQLSERYLPPPLTLGGTRFTGADACLWRRQARGGERGRRVIRREESDEEGTD